MLLKKKENTLFIILSGIFICNALVAEFIGVKIFSLEKTLGINTFNWTFFGYENLSFNLTAGVLLWPVVFVMTDIINEYFGKNGVKWLSYLTVGLILYAFIMFYFAIGLKPADFWSQSHLQSDWSDDQRQIVLTKVGDYNYAYKLVFGQGLWIIVGSVIAFLIGQILDVVVFHKIKRWTGEGKLWLRATGSTLFSQLIDSFVVLFIAFYIGADWDFRLVLAIGIVNYIYKFVMAILLTPIIYALHYIVDKYLGENLALELKQKALQP